MEIEIERITPKKEKRSLQIPRGKLEGIDFVPVGFHSGPNRRRSGYRLILFSWVATVIDALLGLAFNSVLILMSSLVLRGEFAHWMDFFDGSIMRMSVSFFLISISIYQMTLRMFLGFTIGDWACGLRLGVLDQRLSKNYILRVLLRTMVNGLSGFILLPILSLLFGQDFAGKISGLYLVQREITS